MLLMSPGHERLAAAVLDLLLESPHPVGGKALLAGIALGGERVSQAVLARVLLDLDTRGLTVKVGNLGRALTERGRKAARRERTRQEMSVWSNRTLVAVGRSTLLELRQSMVARRAIEREIARLAAEHASSSDIAELSRILKAQADNLEEGGKGGEEAVGLHRALAQACGNRFLATAAEIVRTSSDAMEDLMFQLGATVGTSYEHHAALVEAIAARDAGAAERAMAVHIDELIRDIDAWLGKLGQVQRAENRGA